jgi:DNA-binding transcriptional ArsR family regulator
LSIAGYFLALEYQPECRQLVPLRTGARTNASQHDPLKKIFQTGDRTMHATTGSEKKVDQDLDRLFEEIKTKDFAREAEVFKALGHPTRLKIVYGLVKVGGCNVKNMQECLGLHQATVSQHLIHLKSRGIITSTRHGLEMMYSVNDMWAKCVVDNIERMEKEEEGS